MSIYRLKNLSERLVMINENFQREILIGKKVLIDHPTRGKQEVLVVSENDKDRIFFVDQDGFIGNVKSSRIIKVIEDEDLFKKWFPVNSKGTQYKVPFKIFKETEKACLIGYTHYNGEDITIWIPKKLMTKPIGYSYINKERYERYLLADIFVNNNKPFFEKYAKVLEYYDILNNKKKIEREYKISVEKFINAEETFKKFLEKYNISSINYDSLEQVDYSKSELILPNTQIKIDFDNQRLYYGDNFLSIDDLLKKNNDVYKFLYYLAEENIINNKEKKSVIELIKKYVSDLGDYVKSLHMKDFTTFSERRLEEDYSDMLSFMNKVGLK